MTTQPKRNKAISLSKADVALVKGMLDRNDKQHDIAAYFGVNGGRVAEIKTRKRHSEVRAAKPEDLPPAGPYIMSGRSALKAKETLLALRGLIDQALNEISMWESTNQMNGDL